MPIALRDVVVPDFGLPLEAPRIPPTTYEKRCREAYSRAGCDWLVVYADREHLANVAFLSGYDPRFEEALLLLGPRDRRVLIVGNEGESYAPLAELPGLDIALAQSMSLMGQDRALKPDLAAVLREAGMSTGQTIGLAGWKYFEPAEWDDSSPSLFVPHYLVAMLSRIAGGFDALKDATPVLMHPTTGLRSTIDVDQIALHEWGAARASAAVWRILTGTRLGLSEMEAASAMGYAGEVLAAHVMFTSGDSSHPVIGLRSPGARVIRRGDGATAGIGFWGGLSARAGLIADYDEAFLKTASAYFAGLMAWYEVADIGVAGEAVFAAVMDALARGGLRSALNPGHLTGLDEWIHTPIRPGSPERIASGMPFQVDIIPTPIRAGWALNCEDGIVFSDARLRAELKVRHPAVVERVEARRKFVRDELGIAIRESILPLSSTPLCLPPFWLAAGRLLARV
jgi:Creatinase/Prolidase N-terminal domain